MSTTDCSRIALPSTRHNVLPELPLHAQERSERSARPGHAQQSRRACSATRTQPTTIPLLPRCLRLSGQQLLQLPHAAHHTGCSSDPWSPIESPDVATTLKTGRPNACNLCHLDKTLDWTAEHLAKRRKAKVEVPPIPPKHCRLRRLAAQRRCWATRTGRMAWVGSRQ